MEVLGIALAICAFFLVGSVTGMVATHKAAVGVLPGLVAAIWAAWPFFHTGRVNRYNFLHPVPKKYSVNAQDAFSKIRNILRESSYNFGDKWHVATADVATNRIMAELRFHDKETNLDVAAGAQFRTNVQHVQRYLGLEVQMKSSGNETIVQFDFSPRVEGLNYSACDTIISGFISSTEASLGNGIEVAQPLATRLSAPPWWLLGLTIFMLLVLWGDVQQAVFGGGTP